MSTTLLVIALLALLVFLFVVHAAIVTRRLLVTRPYDEIHHVETDDGWRLSLYRYRAPSSADRPPVVLCHGIAANRHNLDLEDEFSLAWRLHASGRDVWLLELRGCPSAARVGSEPRCAWSFDDHAMRDVPAALRCVGKQSGAAEVDWVGFSMGGLVAYAYFGASEHPELRLRRLVTLGSPVMTRAGRSPGPLGLVARLLGGLQTAPLRLPARALAFAGPALSRVGGSVTGVPGTTAARQLRAAMVNVVCDVGRGVSEQLRGWIAAGRFTSLDGTCDYAAHMRSIRAPALVIGGSADRLAPPRTVRDAFDRLGSAHKELRLFGRQYGHAADYGHVDLVFGQEAPRDVYPLVVEWLERRFANPPAAPAPPDHG